MNDLLYYQRKISLTQAPEYLILRKADYKVAQFLCFLPLSTQTISPISSNMQTTALTV